MAQEDFPCTRFRTSIGHSQFHLGDAFHAGNEPFGRDPFSKLVERVGYRIHIRILHGMKRVHQSFLFGSTIHLRHDQKLYSRGIDVSIHPQLVGWIYDSEIWIRRRCAPSRHVRNFARVDAKTKTKSVLFSTSFQDVSHEIRSISTSDSSYEHVSKEVHVRFSSTKSKAQCNTK